VAVLKKYDLTGEEVGTVTIEESLLECPANMQMIKDYLVALRANARQWSANTKTRAEVCHSGKKPHPQKGTGRARQGYLGAPQYKGGGRVHAPRPKHDQHVRINKKERRAAIRQLFCEKIRENKLHVLNYQRFETPETKRIAHFLRASALKDRRLLFLGEAPTQETSFKESYLFFVKSMENIQKLEFMLFPNISGYDLALAQEVILMEPAFDELMVLLGVGE
jgi:large subunit ribosomal protein L4